MKTIGCAHYSGSGGKKLKIVIPEALSAASAIRIEQKERRWRDMLSLWQMNAGSRLALGVKYASLGRDDRVEDKKCFPIPSPG
jgi:hypothetical protein